MGKSYNESRNEESNTLAIFNLYYKTDQDELRRIFERYGKIEKCNIVNNRRRGQTTAFGFLTFENLDDAREAKEDAHGMEIDGNIIRTDYCLSKGGDEQNTEIDRVGRAQEVAIDADRDHVAIATDPHRRTDHLADPEARSIPSRDP